MSIQDRLSNWMNKSVEEDLRRILGWFKSRKRNILVVVVWAIALSSIVIKSHWTFYLENKKFQRWRMPINQYEGPMLSLLDFSIFFAISIIAGFLIADLENLIYSWIASLILCFCIAVLYVGLYIWCVLEPPILSFLPSPLEWLFEWGSLNVLRMIFPFGVFVCLTGGFLGNILSDVL